MATKTETAHSTVPDRQPASLETAKKLGLREEEYQKIQEIMGRVPNFTELSIYSANRLMNVRRPPSGTGR